MDTHDEPDLATVEQWIKFGAPFWYFNRQPDIEAYAEGVRKWIKASVAAKSPNGVFMDTTTIETALSLLRGDSKVLTPMTLLDLANVTSALIVSDNVFHLESSQIDSVPFNELLGERVFIPIPVSPQDDAVGSFAVGHWRQSRLYLNRVSHPQTRYTKDALAIKEAWEAILGPGIQWDRWQDEQLLFINRAYGEESEPQQFLKEVTALFDAGAMYDRMPAASPGRVGDFVNECNLRSLFNWSIAYAFDLPYLPNSFRLPFQQYLYANGEATRQTIVRFLDDKYHERAGEFGSIEHRVRVPLFLASILARASNLTEVVDLLRETRSKAASFRSRKAELEDAVRREDIKASRELMRALAVEESPKLWYYAGAGAVVFALGWMGAAVHGLHPDPMHGLEIAGEIVGGGLFVKLAEERLLRNLISPRYRVITMASDFASQSMNMTEKVSSLWNTKLGSNFTVTAERIRALKY